MRIKCRWVLLCSDLFDLGPIDYGQISFKILSPMNADVSLRDTPKAGDPPSLRVFLHGLLLVAVLAALYHRVIEGLLAQWWRDPNSSYGFVVPVLFLWMLWNRREKFKCLVLVPNWWGLLLVLGAMGLLVLGTLGAENFLSRTSLLFALAGLAIYFCGWPFFRLAFVPWALLFLMIPLPVIIYNRITIPLQFLASRFATSLLDLMGVPVLREGNIIYLPSISLEVAEACSGMRSLMALITIAVVYAYLFEKKAWRRVSLVLSAIPIAVLANGFRIMGSGLLGQYWSPEKAKGFFHEFSGLLIFCVSCILLWMFHFLLVRISTKNARGPLT
ncbi:MAG: exosortase/archaeosortase family protein [Candidatus Acidiferrum sp.]